MKIRNGEMFPIRDARSKRQARREGVSRGVIENAQERTNAIREEFNLKAVFCMHLERSGAAVVTLSTADDDPPNVLESSSAFVAWLSNIAQDIPVPLKLGLVYDLMQEMGILSAESIDAMARREAMEKLEAKQEEGNA